MISIHEFGKHYGGRTLFRHASLQFHKGCRYGVVGANGSGKSTLLRILAGDEEPGEGTVSIPRNARVGVLRQDHFHCEDVRILDVVMMGHREVWDVMVAKDELLERAHESFDADRYAALEDVIMRHDGYALEARAAEILHGLNIPAEVYDRPLSVLSGGFKLRVLLGQTLAACPDALLLDEPTNHLDILSIRWLEKFLSGSKACVLVVSHDHRFLNNVCTHMVDVDYERLTMYRGNYDAFDEAKHEQRTRKEAEIDKRQKEIEDHKTFIERFKAKPTKARQAKSKAKLVEKIVIEDLPRSSRRYPKFRFVSCRPSGREVVKVEGLTKSFQGRPVLQDVSLRVERGHRLAIIGPNGIGKSTLLKILMDRLDPDAGSVEWGYETHPGYFAQDHRELIEGEEATLQDWLWNFCSGEPIGFVRSQLARVLFEKDEAGKKVANLSGGESARLLFARLAVTSPNVLVLDEPTNHLDLEGIEALADGLGAYDGTLMFVSHDRWFVSRLANRIVEISPDGIRDFHGTYEEYVERCGDDHLDSNVVAALAKQEKMSRSPS